MKKLVVLLLSFTFGFSFVSADENLHSAASRRYSRKYSRVIPQIKKSKKISFELPWSGHFAAKNFPRKGAESIQLKKIQRNIRRSILALPKHHTQALKTLEVLNTEHRSRGMANARKMLLHTKSIDNEDELISVFVHEMGHVVDLGVLKSINGGRTSFFDGKTPVFANDPSMRFYEISFDSAKAIKATALRKDFVSGYAMSNCFEDFAESYLFFRLHGEKFRELAQHSDVLQQKYNFMKKNVFEGKEFQLEKITTSQNPDLWDATLLDIDKGELITKK